MASERLGTLEHRPRMRPSVSDRDVLLPAGSRSSGLTAAIKLRDKAQRRKPTEADVPPPSTFPMTPAARAALALKR